MITIALPVYNEELVLKKNVEIIVHFLNDHVPEPWQIIIANNGSTDATEIIATELSQKFSNVYVIKVKDQGKGNAIARAWISFPAKFLLFMDIDLATDLEALPRMLKILNQGSDIVYGSRAHPLSRVHYSFLRKLLSRGYGLLFRVILNSRVQDPACGFKGVSYHIIKTILPSTNDRKWFFDSELLARAEHQGYRITPIAISWREHPDPQRKSKVPLSLIGKYISALWKLKKTINKKS